MSNPEALATFRTRYQRQNDFPENMQSAVNHYFSILRAYKTRLATLSEDLFTSSSGNVEVPIKDVSPSIPPVVTGRSATVWPLNQHKNVHDKAKLMQFLGIDESIDPVSFSRPDSFSRCM
jgi:hypothetical protein